MMIKACFINGQFFEASNAFIRLNDLGLLRGFSIFDYCRGKSKKPFQLNLYIERFIKSSQLLGLSLTYSDQQLEEMVVELVERVDLDEFGIRFLLTGGYTPDGFTVGSPNLIITIEEFSSTDYKVYADGVKLISYEYLRDFPEIKTTNYLAAIKLQAQRVAENASDILYQYNGKVLELTRSNFFLVKGNTIITPEKNVLKGNTRRLIINLAKNKFTVEERDIDWDELREADEAFLTSTGKKIVPIRQIDNIVIGGSSGFNTTAVINQLFTDFENETFLTH